MTKYIDAERLAKAIEDKGLDCSFALKMERLDTLALIDSLQQEQSKVDLREEINHFLSNATMMDKGEWKGKYPISEMGFGVVARHFFNLGLNARKED